MKTWKIIAIITGIIVLIPILLIVINSFAVLNPSATLPERCMLPAEFSCGGFTAQENSIQFEINNQQNVPVTILSISATGKCFESAQAQSNVIIPEGDTSQPFIFECNNGLTNSPAEYVQADIDLRYQFSNEDFIRNETGRVGAIVR